GQNQKGILYHGAWEPATGDRKLKSSPLTRQQLRHGGEFALLAAKPAMGQPRSQELERLLPEVLNLPGHEPAVRGRPSTSGSLLNEHLGADVVQCSHKRTKK